MPTKKQSDRSLLYRDPQESEKGEKVRETYTALSWYVEQQVDLAI